MPNIKNYRAYWNKSQGFFFILVVALLLFSFYGNSVFAKDECEDISDLDDKQECYEKEIEEQEKKYESTSKKLSSIRDQKDSVLGKIDGLLSQLSVTQAEINSLQSDIDDISNQLDEINKGLEERRLSLGKKLELRNTVLKSHYQEGNLTPMELLITTLPSSATSNLNGFKYLNINSMFNQLLTDEALKIISMLNTEINSFEADKKESEKLMAELSEAKVKFIATKNTLDNQHAIAKTDLNELSEEEEEVEENLESIQEKLESLTAKQQEILSAKSGEDVISGYESASYKLPEPPFKPAFAAMSYGAYTHRNGLSQYGAKARADDGQDYKEIIKFYYKQGTTEKDGLDEDKICVQGHGDMKFNEYLYGLGEMPPSWHEEALKAQAIAARSYAYRYIKKDACICTTTSCQYFDESLVDRSDRERWRDAVDATADKLIDGSTDAAGYGWYSSTTGGYINNVGWDDDGNWPGDAYEKKAGSPWFYKAWYTESYRDNSSTCGRSTPWLKEEEMADILNSWVVWDKGSGSERDHITPVTTNCWGGDPYSHDEMEDKAEKYGKKFTSVSKVYDPKIGSGKTIEICFDTNQGKVCIDGQDFARVFNMRAPGYVAIRRDTALNALFDIEYKN